MAGSLNRVMLIGHVGKDAELKYTPSGNAQAKFSVATNHNTKKGDQWESETTWHNVILWGDSAERLAGHITKGKAVYVEGRIQTRTWDDDKGKHYMTEVIAQTVQLLDKRDGTEGRTKRESFDDLPFE